MNDCYVWISVLTPLYEKAISAALTSKGYTISATDGKSVANGNCLAYFVQHETKKFRDVEADMVDIISQNNIYYHMLLVTKAPCTSMWRSSNIVFNSLSKEEQEIEDAMAEINQLLSSYKIPPLNAEERKRLIEKRKNS